MIPKDQTSALAPKQGGGLLSSKRSWRNARTAMVNTSGAMQQKVPPSK
jgi:hypothetical protein